LIVLAGAAVRLPGRALTAAVIVAAAVIAAAVVVARSSLGWRPGLRAAGVVVAAFALSMLPFLANWRTGILGMNFNNDSAVHVIWAAALGDDVVRSNYVIPESYPIGPHAFVAAIGKLTSIELDTLFNGLMVATALALATSAQSFLRRVPAAAAIVVGALVALPYLPAGYYGQGSFKEILQPLFLIAFVALLREKLHDSPRERRAVLAAGIAPGLVAAAAVYTYSYVGAVWLVGAVAVWAAAEVAAASIAARRLTLPAPTRAMTAVVIAGAIVGMVGILPDVDRVLGYFTGVGTNPADSGAIEKANLGNLAGPLSPYEALGLWDRADYRFPPAHQFHAGQLAMLALGAGVFAAFWWLRRRDFSAPAVVAASAAIYYQAKNGQSPYVAAKALVILAPPFILMVGRAMFERPQGRWQPALDATALRYAVGVLFAVFALYSSSVVLRGSQVAPDAQFDQLRELSKRAGTRPTVFLGNDDFVGWEMRRTRLSYVSSTGLPSPIPLEHRPEKAWVYGQPLDFDSVPARYLDGFEFVVTTRSAYESQAPANFRVVARTPQYLLWERRGPTPARSTVDRDGAPGALLDCRRPAARRLSRKRGVAHVSDPPVVAPALPALTPGQSASVAFKLPRGRWSLSVQYVSPTALEFSIGGRGFELPAYLGRPGPFFRVGEVDSDGTPQPLTVRADDPSPLASLNHVAQPGVLVAQRVGSARDVPLSEACGRYVDWYRTSS
jgi:hypothetical protein